MGFFPEFKYLWAIAAMTDTPQHIYEIQLKAWLVKTPGQRLLQFLKDNDAMRVALKKTKDELQIPDTVTSKPATNDFYQH